jgi:hypothetical protein
MIAPTALPEGDPAIASATAMRDAESLAVTVTSAVAWTSEPVPM